MDLNAGFLTGKWKWHVQIFFTEKKEFMLFVVTGGMLMYLSARYAKQNQSILNKKTFYKGYEFGKL